MKPIRKTLYVRGSDFGGLDVFLYRRDAELDCLFRARLCQDEVRQYLGDRVADFNSARIYKMTVTFSPVAKKAAKKRATTRRK